MIFLNKQCVKTSLLTTLMISAILGTEEVTAQEVENVNTNIKEGTVKPEENFKDQLELFLTNITISIEVEENLTLAIEKHQSRDFETAKNLYKEILSTFDLDDEFANLVFAYVDLATHELELKEENVQKYLSHEDTSIKTDENAENEVILGDNIDESKEKITGTPKEKVSSDDNKREKNLMSGLNLIQNKSLRATEMYEAVINASNASSAWMRAQEFKDTYPNDSRLEEAINVAADRIYSMGKASHKNNEFSAAIHYYELIISEVLVTESIRNEANIYYNQANNHYTLMTANNMYDAVINAPIASEAWDAVQAYKEYYSNDVNLQAAVDHAANRIFTQGQINHKNANLSTAIHYYELLLE